MSRILLFIAFSLLVSLWSHASSAWTISSGEISIYLPEEPSPSEQFAAEELQTWIQEMSGQTLEITHGSPLPEEKAIILGKHFLNEDLLEGAPDANQDHYILDRQGNHVRITGLRSATDRAVLYGVYHFLENQGIRWFQPTPHGTHVPQQTQLVLPDGREDHRPVFPLRWGVALYATASLRTATPEETERARIWALRNRASVVGLGDPKYGGFLRVGGGGHIYSSIVPRKLFAQHPEFFPLINGERRPEGQICVGNPDLQEFFANEIIRRNKTNPGIFMYSVDPNDGRGWCECELCTAMDDPNLLSGRGDGVSMSNRVYTFNNIIAEKVKKEVPDLLLYCLAYATYMEAPTKPEYLADNLVVGLAPFAGAFSDYSRPLLDPESGPNRRFMEAVSGFARYRVKMYAREYLSHYMWPGPLPLLWVMQDRFQVYEDFGFIGAYSETHPTWGPQGMILYMYLRLMWNPHLDLQQELEAYCSAFYGPAYKPMLRYHELIEKQGQGGPYFGSGGSHAQRLFTPKFLAELKPLVEEAQRLVAGNAPYERRVEGVVAGYEFARLYRQTEDLIKQGKPVEAEVALAELRDLYGNRYPDGDIFNKGEGATDRPAALRSLITELAKINRVESRLKRPHLLAVLDSDWKFQTDPEGKGVSRGWHQHNVIDSHWAAIQVGAPWQHQGFSNYTGTAWYRRSFSTPEIKSGKQVVLAFDAVDGDTTVWINGQEIGSHELLDLLGNVRWDEPFFFDVTRYLRPRGTNTLAVRVTKNDGMGGIHRQVRLFQTDAQ